MKWLRKAYCSENLHWKKKERAIDKQTRTHAHLPVKHHIQLAPLVQLIQALKIALLVSRGVCVFARGELNCFMPANGGSNVRHHISNS